MDPNLQNHDEDSKSKTSSELQNENLLPIIPPSRPFAAASITLSLSTLIPLNNPFFQSKLSALFSHHPNRLKVPTQACSIAHLSLSSSTLSPPKKLSFKSTISSNPLQNPLSLNPSRPSDPSNGAAIRRASIVWFRNDLRVHDNECLNSAQNESMSVLPVYCFDPRDYGKSSSGFDKTGPYRATFLIESVSDLRKNLQARGSDLVVRVGKPESVLVELAKETGAEAVYVHREVSHEEVKAEERIEAAMKEENVEVKYFWGSTLYHVDDLPFGLGEMPSNYGGFREKVKGLDVRKTIEALDQMKGLPSTGNVEVGEIPSLVDLGLNPAATMAKEGRAGTSGVMAGGETEALEKLRKFAAECQAQPPKGTKKGTHESIYGANFSCKISPWLAMGCLSTRTMFDQLKNTTSRTISASSNGNNGGRGGGSGDGMNWLMFELLWRDFFRFITKKYSSAKRQVDTAPVTACTGALA